MATSKNNTKKEGKKLPVIPTLVFGCISITGYYYLMANQDLVTDTFTKGGWYAAFPLLTAFLFSFIHGAFASNFLSVLGIEAKK